MHKYIYLTSSRWKSLVTVPFCAYGIEICRVSRAALTMHAGHSKMQLLIIQF